MTIRRFHAKPLARPMLIKYRYEMESKAPRFTSNIYIFVKNIYLNMLPVVFIQT